MSYNIFEELKDSKEIIKSIDEIVDAIFNDKQILAIKLCRAAAGWGLKESNDYINKLRTFSLHKLVLDKDIYKEIYKGEDKCTIYLNGQQDDQNINKDIGIPLIECVIPLESI